MARERFSMEEAGVNLLLLEHDTEPGSLLGKKPRRYRLCKRGRGRDEGKERRKGERGGGKDTEERETETDTDIWA